MAESFLLPIRPSVAQLLAATGGSLLYLSVLAVYRLYFHPIAKFPGSKLAALSQWYEFYYDCILPGQFEFHMQDLHEKYGPVIRINPEELHIQDSDVHDEFYSRAARRDKYEHDAGRLGNNTSLFTTSDHNLHALRRSCLHAMFSRRAISNFQPVILEKIELLCNKIAQYAEDVICEYCFGFCYNHLETPDFKDSFHDPYMALTALGHVAVQFPWIHSVIDAILEWLGIKLNPGFAIFIKLKGDLKQVIQKQMASEDDPLKSPTHPTVFNELLQSPIPPEEKSIQHLIDEAESLIGGGLMTASWALTVATYHLIAAPHHLIALRHELDAALPSPTAEADWCALEKLPYLTACINEAVRLSFGISHRNPRVSRAPLAYGSWTIPAGTPVSMTAWNVLHDETVFENSWAFVPERWLGGPATVGGAGSLGRYFVPFGKDARSCLGINLAWAEMYLALATLFRRFDFELYKTDVSDVTFAHDFFVPAPKLDSKGVRVKVKLRS